MESGVPDTARAMSQENLEIAATPATSAGSVFALIGRNVALAVLENAGTRRVGG